MRIFWKNSSRKKVSLRITSWMMNAISTGTALIFVADSGENCIAVAPGANYSLLPDAVIRFEKVIDEADMIVMQAEFLMKR